MKKAVLKAVIPLLLLALVTKRVYALSENWVKTPFNTYYTSSIEVTPYGILAGERDSRLWTTPAPYNGIWVSTDLGQTWRKTGLDGRGVTDIAYSNSTIYASTYYYVGSAKVLRSSDGGQTWEPLGLSFTSSKVAVAGDTVFLGGYSHGLWVSQDAGENWVQKLGDGIYGPRINLIEASPEVAIVSTTDAMHYSTDGGNTWEEITDVNGKIFKYAQIEDAAILGCTWGSPGLYKSTDYAQTWEMLSGWGGFECGAISYYDGYFYVGRQSAPDQWTIVRSADNGITWENTNLNLSTYEEIRNIDWLASDPSYIYAHPGKEGLYKYDIPSEQMAVNQFLGIPWENVSAYDLLDTITSYFDHQYPLLGYTYYSEPPEASTTTLNYLGTRAAEPEMYYSTHDGIDFGLVYGTEILSPAAGVASYYHCTACGHTIKVDHQNGYQTTYMHLQGSDLVATGTEQIAVSVGSVLGKVGLTGNTTGPHLHFATQKDLNSNGDFTDDWPDSNNDPFGWQDLETPDPWGKITWTDTLGTHNGTKSYYLWQNPVGMTEETDYINEIGGVVQTGNKTLRLAQDVVNIGLTILLRHAALPRLSDAQTGLQYLKTTSTLITAFDNLGIKVKTLATAAEIELDFDPNLLANIKPETLKIYYWDEALQLWNALPSIVDLVANKITAQTTHFSHFAAFGEAIDITPPQTDILLIGTKENGWYKTYPIVTLVASDDLSAVRATLYSLDSEVDWQEYTSPFTIQRDGVYTLSYKSLDSVDNLEGNNELIIRIDTKGGFEKRVKVTEANFEIGIW